MCHVTNCSPTGAQLAPNRTQLEFDFSPNLCYNKYRKKDKERGNTMKIFLYKVIWFNENDFEEKKEEGLICGENLADVSAEIDDWQLDLVEMSVRPLVTDWGDTVGSDCPSISFEELVSQAREGGMQLCYKAERAANNDTASVENTTGDCCNDR